MKPLQAATAARRHTCRERRSVERRHVEQRRGNRRKNEAPELMALPKGWREHQREKRRQQDRRRDAWVQRSVRLRQAIAAANELALDPLTDAEIANLVAFLKSLTDPRSRDLSSTLASHYLVDHQACSTGRAACPPLGNGAAFSLLALTPQLVCATVWLPSSVACLAGRAVPFPNTATSAWRGPFHAGQSLGIRTSGDGY